MPWSVERANGRKEVQREDKTRINGVELKLTTHCL